MSKHTPGPWIVGGPYPSVSVIRMVDAGSANPENPEPPTYEPVAILHFGIDGKAPPDQTKADAELIAAAPDLLNALNEAVGLLRIFHGEPGWLQYQCSPEMKRINSAIANAGGGWVCDSCSRLVPKSMGETCECGRINKK